MRIQDFVPGQTVYVYDFEYRNNPIVTERIVKKVGRKYVTISGSWVQQFYQRRNEDSFLCEKTEYGITKYLFESKESLDNYIKLEDLKKWARSFPNKIDSLSLEQLAAIKSIVEGVLNEV